MFTNINQIELFFKQRANFGIKPGLDRIKCLLKFCGNPEKKIDSVHVAGTNGKGSTIQYMKNVLMCNGYDVGVFLSPSLDGIMGHMTISDEQICSSEFIELLNELYPKILVLDEQNNHPTEFEIITVIAFMFFQRHAQIALIEAGMGGREDTTNCLEPLLSIITSVDFDHMQFLGDTIEEIAYEKAGIIKKNRPVIIGEVVDGTRMTIKKVANELKAPLFELGNQFTYQEKETPYEGQLFVWTFQSNSQEFSIQQKGLHQIKNCSLAIMALRLLKNKGFDISITNLLKGIKSTKIPGRFEQISTNPLIIVDGAHNVAGVKAFIKTVETNYKDVHKTLVFAAFRDKEIEEMLTLLSPYFSTIILTTFKHPRAATTSELSTYMCGKNNNIILMDQQDFSEFVDEIRFKVDYDHYFFTGSLSFIKVIKELFEIK